MKSLQFEAQTAWNFDEPTNENLSHVGANVSLPFNVVLWDDRVGFSCFDVSDDVLSVVSYLRVEVFGVWERILNLNFAGQILNFGNLVGLCSPWTPSQGKDSAWAFFDFLLCALRLWVYRALIRIHPGFSCF